MHISRTEQAQNLAGFTAKVDEVIRIGNQEPGVAHKLQDTALLTLVILYAPKKILDEVDRLLDADFPRWYE